MSTRLRYFLLFTVVMVATAAFGDPTIVNFNFGAVPIVCGGDYAYQGTSGCGLGQQDFNAAPSFGWILEQFMPPGEGEAGLTGPGTSFLPLPFTGLPFTQAVFLQGGEAGGDGHNSFVWQEVGGFLAGSYTLSFYLGSRYASGQYDGNQTVEALIDGNVIGTWALTSYTPFTLESVQFTVSTGGTHTLEFMGINNGDHTAFLSYVSITQTGATGATWDATKDFGASNPNGIWSYGYGITGTSFTLDPFYNTDCEDIWGASGVVCWTAETYYDHTPLVSFNTTGNWLNFATVVDPPDVLLVHPGHYEDQDSIVRWAAPVAGYYNIAGFFEILDTNPTGIIGLVFRNGTLLYSGELLGPPAQHPNQVGGRENFNFSTLFLNAGDVISFGVNKDGAIQDDSTGFNATITIPPTPCALCSH
jgi:hypothetical protein